MQLTDFRVDAFGSVRNVSLNRLEPGLTGVYGSNGSGKTTVLQFLRGTFGDRSASFWDHTHTTPSGHVDVLAKNGRREVVVNGKGGADLMASTALARLATVTASEANNTGLVESLAGTLGIPLEDTTVDLTKEREAHRSLQKERVEISNAVASADAELARVEEALRAAEAEAQRTSDRLASQAVALRAAVESTRRDVERTHGDYQAGQSDLTEWETDAWRPRRVTQHVEEVAAEPIEQPIVTRDGADLKTALLEIAQLRCKASARRADAAAGGPLDLCGNTLSEPLQIADEIRSSLDRLRNAAGTVPAAGLATRIDDLMKSLANQQRAVDWLEADRTRVLLDRCERDLEQAALRKCSVCADGATACDTHTCAPRTTTRTVETFEPEADHAWGARLNERRAKGRHEWQSSIARHLQARRHLEQFDAEVARAARDGRITRLIAERDAALKHLDELRLRLAALDESIAALEAILAEERAPSGPLFDAGNYFQRLTCGHYAGLTRGRSGRTELRAMTAGGQSVALDELSRGTQAQAALAMRLSLLDVLAEQGERPPLILDDVLVDSDRERAEAGIALLKEWSRHRQTLLMTCQRQLIDAMNDGDVTVRTLHGESIAPTVRRESVITQTTIKPSDATVQMAVSRAIGDTPPKVLPITPAKTRSVATTSLTASDAETTPASYWLDPDSMIVRVPSISETDARRLGSIGVESIEHLVLIDGDAIEADLVALQINPRDFGRWQSEARLLCVVPGLSARDAQLLAWADIQTADELASIDVETLRSRLTGLSRNSSAKHLRVETESFSTDRLNRWRSRGGRSRSSRSLFTNRPRLRSVRENRRDRRRETEREPRAGGGARTLSVVERRRSIRRGSETERSSRSSRRSDRQTTRREKRSSRETSATATEWRHYLETNSPVVDAPSIGPKMAKRLAKHGVKTVSDLLNADPAKIARGLDDRRIKKQTIIDWQDQARLMCQIPMLRGHDAQVLVACDFRDVSAVASKEPNQLFSIVGPFVKTKEGERLLRSSKVPDLEEVGDWINWSRHARSLKAA